MSEYSGLKAAGNLGRAFATSLLSKLCVAYPAIGDRIVGPDPAEWRVAKTVGIGQWLTVDGDPNSGRFPVDYTSSAVISADKEHMARIASLLDGVPAAAYAIGRFAMVAPLRPRLDGSQMPDAMEPPALPDGAPEIALDGRDAVIFGVGQGALHATIGVYRERGGVFLPAAHIEAVPLPGITPVQAMHSLSTVPVV